MAASSKAQTKKNTKTLRHHIVQSLLTVAPHQHTGKRLKHSTSHGAIFGLLIVTGVLLFSNLGMLTAYGVTQSGAVHVSVNVQGHAPTVGATINFPQSNSTTGYALVAANGSCPNDTLVVIYNNGLFAGSTICSVDQFSLVIQLTKGLNVMQAQNYDGLNQAGPTTAQIAVLYNAPKTETPDDNSGATEQATPDQTANTSIATTIDEVIPQKAAIVESVPTVPQPDQNNCFDADAKTTLSSSAMHIAVGCMQRNVFAGELINLPLHIDGGLAPFALAVNWGDTKEDLVTVLNSTKRILAHTYTVGGFHYITLKATDSQGTSTRIQTTVSVNGDGTTDPVASSLDKFINNAETIWVESPVPLYIAAVTLAVGFWIGDIFQRYAVAHARPAASARPTSGRNPKLKSRY